MTRATSPEGSERVTVAGSEMAYVDVGDGPLLLFVHGNPTWSFQWRGVIAALADRYRCVAPDLIGMGRSDRPDIDYTYAQHVCYLEGFVDALDLHDGVPVLHDWGCALGIDLARRDILRAPALTLIVEGASVIGGVLHPLDSWATFPENVRDVLRAIRGDPAMRHELLVEQNMFIEVLLPSGIRSGMTSQEMDAYRAVYPDEASRAAIAAWPTQIPVAGEPPDVCAAVAANDAWLRQTDRSVLIVHAGRTGDDVTVVDAYAEIGDLTSAGVGSAGHYMPEDRPDEIARALDRWYGTLRARDGA